MQAKNHKCLQDCTSIAIDADSKILIFYLVGLRDAGYVFEFMQDVASRLANRVQLTTDSPRAYLDAVESTFATDIDNAQLVKIYGDRTANRRNTIQPAEMFRRSTACDHWHPDEASHISTSYVERSNLTLRFTRLTRGFSKKIENHIHALAL